MQQSKSDKWSSRIGIAAIVAIFLVVAWQVMQSRVFPGATDLNLGEGRFKARVVSSEAGRAKGLSGTSELPEGQAMLLIYEKEGRPGIWMKDMNYPIDIIWLDASKAVVDYREEVSPDTYPTVFTPGSDARYVVELTSGEVKRQAIRIGQVAEFYVGRERS